MSLQPLSSLNHELDFASLTFGLDFASSYRFRLSVDLVRRSSYLIRIYHLMITSMGTNPFFLVSLSFFLSRTVHSPTCSAGNSRNPADSTGIRRTQIPECLGVTRAKSASLFWEESGGVHWKPAYSSRVCGIRLDFLC